VRTTGLTAGLIVTALARAALAGNPGVLESVSCESIAGWAVDPQEPSARVPVELAFDAASSGSTAGAVKADVPRDDLCAALGSCEHGFRIAPPFSLFDGAEHWVFAYANDAALTTKTELADSPRLMSCPPVEVQGIKRRLANPASVVEWRLNPFWHEVALDDAKIAELPEGSVLPQAPIVARADDGSPELWLLDGQARREVPMPWGLANWHVATESVEERPAAELYSVPRGPALPDRPMIVRSSKGDVFLIDQGEDPMGSADFGGLPAYEGPAMTDDPERSACAARVAGAAPPAAAWPALLCGGLSLLALRRRASTVA
jgi:hypothetical protein